MTGAETHILRIVHERRKVDVPTIAHAMGVSVDYVTPKVERLVKDGYLLEAEKGVYNDARRIRLTF